MSAAAVEAAAVRERGLLLSAPMVIAALKGRKVNTRRLLDPFVQPDGDVIRFDVEDGVWYVEGGTWSRRCPYGLIGDRLWVREAWRTAEALDKFNATQIAAKALDANYDRPWAPLVYEADGAERDYDRTAPLESGGWGAPGRKRLARFMPRWASRITLEITDVRVQRLNDISEEDAKAEGVEPTVTQESWSCMRKDGTAFDIFVAPTPEWPGADLVASVHVPAERISTARENFARLWDSLNAERAPWSSSPWVWCISFRRVEATR